MVTVIRNKMSYVSNLRSSCTKRCSLLEGDKKKTRKDDVGEKPAKSSGRLTQLRSGEGLKLCTASCQLLCLGVLTLSTDIIKIRTPCDH